MVPNSTTYISKTKAKLPKSVSTSEVSMKSVLQKELHFYLGWSVPLKTDNLAFETKQ